MRLSLLTALVVGAAVSSSAQAGGPSLLVADREGNRLVVIDPVARTVRARIAVGPGPHEVATSADGKLAFVSNYGDQTPGHTLSVIDLETLKEVRRVDLGALTRPHGLAVVDGCVYFTAESNRSIGRYDPKADKVDRIVGVGQEGTHMVAASPDGKTLFTADIGSNSVSIIRRDTGELSHVEVPSSPEGIAISPDGGEVWVGSRKEGKIAILDVGKSRVKETITVPATTAARLRFTPDGRRVFLPDPQGGKLLAIDARSRKVDKEIPLAGAPVGAAFDAEGRFIYVPLAAEGVVAILDRDNYSRIGTIQAERISDGMAYVPGPKPEARLPMKKGPGVLQLSEPN